ncbi:hypothetical protein KHDHEBDM_01716 [Pectobacterium polaris]|nr:hypothetical protein KHDHEBDM_01716 [Pectobacterium polaris]
MVGLVCIILGYKLLVKGIFDGGADIEGAWSENKKLVVKRGSPGVLLFLFGFGIIIFSVFFSRLQVVPAQENGVGDRGSLTPDVTANVPVDNKKSSSVESKEMQSSYPVDRKEEDFLPPESVVLVGMTMKEFQLPGTFQPYHPAGGIFNPNKINRIQNLVKDDCWCQLQGENKDKE